MSSINSRIINLQKAIEARRMEQEAPIDLLSLSLYELQGWASGLDEQGKAAVRTEQWALTWTWKL